MTVPQLPPEHVEGECDFCHEPMDMQRAVWWCPNGIACSERCAQHLTADLGNQPLADPA